MEIGSDNPKGEVWPIPTSQCPHCAAELIWVDANPATIEDGTCGRCSACEQRIMIVADGLMKG